ncbi:MAG: hypothetical protein INQ03_02650 [Candidatus Heimdallarchaeota archaeon]|nr:hypothetical protein [Candidatus Heimdallarchaeota archaeon]
MNKVFILILIIYLNNIPISTSSGTASPYFLEDYEDYKITNYLTIKWSTQKVWTSGSGTAYKLPFEIYLKNHTSATWDKIAGDESISFSPLDNKYKYHVFSSNYINSNYSIMVRVVEGNQYGATGNATINNLIFFSDYIKVDDSIIVNYLGNNLTQIIWPKVTCDYDHEIKYAISYEIDSEEIIIVENLVEVDYSWNMTGYELENEDVIYIIITYYTGDGSHSGKITSEAFTVELELLTLSDNSRMSESIYGLYIHIISILAILQVYRMK